MKQLYAIKVAARKTGLTTHAIRVWEKRYSAVVPERTPTNRRLYSDTQIERLALLKKLTFAGHAISRLANLPTKSLQTMLTAEVGSEDLTPRVGEATPAQPKPLPQEEDGSSFLADAMDGVRRLDSNKLEASLDRAVLRMSQPAMLQKVIVPLIQQIGDEWWNGRLQAAHEHVATAVIRTFLGNFSRPFALPVTAPEIVVTTPAGQLHELGAILVAAAANNLGWRVTYLGPSLPAEEIAGAVTEHNTKALALSIVYPEDDPYMASELTRLRKLVGNDVTILIGGRASCAYEASIKKIKAIMLSDLPSLYTALDGLRKSPQPAA